VVPKDVAVHRPQDPDELDRHKRGWILDTMTGMSRRCWGGGGSGWRLGSLLAVVVSGCREQGTTD
jgi:hypothetical protein